MGYIRNAALCLSVISLVAAGVQPATACYDPLPANVGVSFVENPPDSGNFDFSVFGGEAFGGNPGENCGCGLAIPGTAQIKFGCSVVGATVTEPDGTPTPFGSWSVNATTASSLANEMANQVAEYAADPGAFTVFGFVATLSSGLAAGLPLKLTFTFNCPPEVDRSNITALFTNSGIIGTGPALPDGSLDLGDPTHIGFSVARINDKCQVKKKKCVAKKAAGLLKCHAKAEKDGTVVDPDCVNQVKSKFDDPIKGCIAKTEKKGGCIVTGATATLETTIDTFVEVDTVPALDPFFPGPIPGGNICSSKKKGCVAKKVSGLLKCHAKAEKKGLAVDPLCVQKVTDKFDGGPDPTKGCFAKLEANLDCLTASDTAAIEAVVDAFVEDAVCQIDPSTCP